MTEENSDSEFQFDDPESCLDRLDGEISTLKEKLVNSFEFDSDELRKRLNSTEELFSEARTVMSQIEEAKQQFDSQVENEFMTVLKECQKISKEIAELTDTADVLKETLRAEETLEGLENSLRTRQYVAAVDYLLSLESMFSSAMMTQLRDEVSAFSTLHQEFVCRKEKVFFNLKEAWSQSVQWSTLDEKQQLTMLNGSELQSVLQAMNNLSQGGTLSVDLVASVVKEFSEKLFNHVLTPLLVQDNEATVSAKNESFVVQVGRRRPQQKQKQQSKKGEESAALTATLNTIAGVIEALNQFIGFVLIKDNVSLLQLIGRVIGDRFVTRLTSECIMSSIPSSVAEFERFDSIFESVESFQSRLLKVGFLQQEQSKSICCYLNDFQLLFVQKKCLEMVIEARRWIRSPLHETQFVGEVLTESASSGSKQDDCHEIDENFALPNELAHFPKCQVSKGAIKLAELVYTNLSEASKMTDSRANKIAYCAHNLFHLYLEMVPMYHKDVLTELPQTSAIFLNSCMFLAHHLLTLGHQFPAVCFADLVAKTRSRGQEIFRKQLMRQKSLILESLQQTYGLQMISEKTVRESVFKAAKQVNYQLEHLASVWRDVMPNGPFNSAMAFLLNIVLGFVVDSLLQLVDISADDASQLHILMNSLLEPLPRLFISNEPVALAQGKLTRWYQFKELQLALNATLQEIVDRWADGKGPLANEFSAEQVASLIRALFQNTERRANALAKIRSS